MKCYRVYADNEVVGTYFSLAQAVEATGIWLEYGYDVEVKKENY